MKSACLIAAFALTAAAPVHAAAPVSIGVTTILGGPMADRVDASGIGGNDYIFEPISSDRDSATGARKLRKEKGVRSAADDNALNKINVASIKSAAAAAGFEAHARASANSRRARRRDRGDG